MRNVQRVPVSSTSHAAELASKESGAGAICSSVCAEIYGLKILDRDIEDLQGTFSHNYNYNIIEVYIVININELIYVFISNIR